MSGAVISMQPGQGGVETPAAPHRGAIDGLVSSQPLGGMLPGLYQEDDFAQRFTQALDTVLAPALWTLESLEGYLDPLLAPSDFLEWLAGWVGVALDETWPVERQRQLVAQAVETYRWLGTARGLRMLMAIYTGQEPEIIETGGVTWSAAPGSAAPGRVEPHVTVRVRVTDPASVDLRRLEAVVAAATPAHVPHTIEVVTP